MTPFLQGLGPPNLDIRIRKTPIYQHQTKVKGTNDNAMIERSCELEKKL